MNAALTFDAAAKEYAQQLQQGISLSGETADYFVQGRVAYLAGWLAATQRGLANPQVLDFGCGVGNACGSLQQQLQAANVVGLDCSVESLQLAVERFPSAEFQFTLDGSQLSSASIDVAYTSGVFHHIPPQQRQAELEKIFRWLKPGGWLAFFENNPWNPGTRWVMSRIEFDRDAQCLSPLEARRRLRAVGFELQPTRTLFYFPKRLRCLRPLESTLGVIPLGAQYVVLAQRPA